jgi:hypothetical protein
MNRAALEHILRAAAAVTNEPDIVVVGSQALLGQYPNAPDPLLSSIEADVFPRADPVKWSRSQIRCCIVSQPA